MKTVARILLISVWLSTGASFGQTPSFQWVQQLGGASPNSLSSMVVDGDGNRYVVGTFKQRFTVGSTVLVADGLQNNTYILKLDPKGQVIWARQGWCNGTGVFLDGISASAAAVDSSGNLIVAGCFTDTAFFGQTSLTARGVLNVYLVKYDAVGNVVWARMAGGTQGWDAITDLTVDENNNYYITGYFPKGTMIFGTGTSGGSKAVSTSAENDMFLAKYDYSGTLVWVTGGWSSTGNNYGSQVFMGGSTWVCTAGCINSEGEVPAYQIADGSLIFPTHVIQTNGTGSTSSIRQYLSSGSAYYANFQFSGKVTMGNTQLSSTGLTNAVIGINAGWVIFFNTPVVLALGPNGELYGSQLGSPPQVFRLDPKTGERLWTVQGQGNSYISKIIPNPDGSLMLAGTFVSPSVTLGTFTMSTTSEGSFIARLSDVPDFDWVQHAGGSKVTAGAKSVAIDAAGNRFVTGWFEDQASFSGSSIESVDGSQDFFLAKYDRAGTFQWVRQGGGSGFEEGSSVAVDRAGNCYVTGGFEQSATFSNSNLVSKGDGDIFLAKYSPEGALLWIRQFGGPGYDYGTAVAVDAGGNCYLTGFFEQKAQFGATPLTSRGDYDIFLAKFSPAGDQLWVQQAGDSEDDRAFGLAVDPAGNCYLTGFFTTYATFGSFDVNSSGGHDIFLAKYNSSGVPQWVSTAGGDSMDNGYGVALDQLGDAYVTGFIYSDTADFGGVQVASAGGDDIFAAKFSPSGRCIWAKTFGGTSDDDGEAIAVDRLGNCYVTGEFALTSSFGNYTLTSQGDRDAVLAKLDGNNGNVLWVKQVGGTGTEYGNSIAIDGEQNWTWAGYFEDSVQFDTQNLYAYNSDMFLATAAPFVNPRVVGAQNSEGVLGANVTVPITLAAQGNENAFALTLTFDPTVLTNAAVVAGDGKGNAGIAQMVVNDKRIQEGLLGISALLSPGQALAAGSTQFLTASFNILKGTKASTTTVGFSDQVVIREIDDAVGQYLTVDYAPGTVSIIRGYEGDVAPPGGDNQVGPDDWVKEGRFVAGLDTPKAGDEFVRADCAPYIVNLVPILGDGAITLADWVEVGRLALGLDAKMPQGGPGQVPTLSRCDPVGSVGAPKAGGPRPLDSTRVLQVLDLSLAPGQTGQLLVQLQAIGGENTMGFSLTLDPGLLNYVGAQPGDDMSGGTLMLNTEHLADGHLGVLLGLPSGQSLSAGTKNVLKISVQAQTLSGNWTSRVDLVDFPARRQIVDASAGDLPVDYEGAVVAIGSAPSLKPRITNPQIINGGFQFSAEGFSSGTLVIEASENLRDWQPISTNTASIIVVPDVVGHSQRFFRAVAQ